MSRVHGYDIIGDIHGCALTLERLLEQMGYARRQGVYEHPNRTAIFVGDIIDRGPRIREALHLVREMVDRGAALIVMGNHEYNALGYCTLARPGSGRRHVREHNERHNRLIRATLEQFEHYDDEWHEFLDWFYELPLFLEMDRFRVVHACWDEKLIRQFEQQHPSGCIDEDFLHASMAPGSFAGRVMDRLLRGTAMKLPDGMTMTGRDGFQRQFFRTRFWGEDARTYGDIVFQPDPLPESVSNRALSPEERDQLITYGPNERPLFIGHYWLQGVPEPIAPNVACLDYSAVKYGKLVAYRMDDETRLDPQKFVWVDVTPSEQD